MNFYMNSVELLYQVDGFMSIGIPINTEEQGELLQFGLKTSTVTSMFPVVWWKCTAGSKQAPRAWYIELQDKLTTHGFITTCRHLSFRPPRRKEKGACQNHCLRSLVAANTSKQVTDIVNTISKIWDVRNLGEPSDLLSNQIIRYSSIFISIHQTLYITQVWELLSIQSMPAQALPMDPKLQFVKETGPPSAEPEQYRKLVHWSTLPILLNQTSGFRSVFWLGTIRTHESRTGLTVPKCSGMSWAPPPMPYQMAVWQWWRGQCLPWRRLCLKHRRSQIHT